MNGTNLIEAYEAAMKLALIRGQLIPGFFERRPVLIWAPAAPAGVA